MTNEQLTVAMGEAPHYSDPDAFVSDLLTSSMGLDVSEAEQLRHVWMVACAPFRDLLDGMGLRQVDVARRHGIPLRTVQRWANGTSECAPYVRRMIAELNGYLA